MATEVVSEELSQCASHAPPKIKHPITTPLRTSKDGGTEAGGRFIRRATGVAAAIALAERGANTGGAGGGVGSGEAVSVPRNPIEAAETQSVIPARQTNASEFNSPFSKSMRSCSGETGP